MLKLKMRAALAADVHQWRGEAVWSLWRIVQRLADAGPMSRELAMRQVFERLLAAFDSGRAIRLLAVERGTEAQLVGAHYRGWGGISLAGSRRFSSPDGTSSSTGGRADKAGPLAALEQEWSLFQRAVKRGREPIPIAGRRILALPERDAVAFWPELAPQPVTAQPATPAAARPVCEDGPSGVTPSTTAEKPDPATFAKAVKAGRLEGLNVEQVSQRYGVSKATGYRWLKVHEKQQQRAQKWPSQVAG